MSWLFKSNPLDELVEKATAESLPSDSEDLALNLEICDRIRSKAVPAKDAMRSLRKRISNKNPNVQLLALKLCDLCVKNGGSHFLVEIASREFMDNLTSLLKSPYSLNGDVKEKILELVQLWASISTSRSELEYVSVIYRNLRSEGFQFPAEQRLSANFVDTAAPPDWTDSEVCMRCRTAFTFTNRKHHCRSCGNVFCGQCSSKTLPLLHLGITTPVRVCDGCYDKRTMATSNKTISNSIATHRTSEHQASQSLGNSGAAGRRKPAASAVDEEDLDFKRALQLSLEESRSSADRPPPSKPVQRRPSTPGETEDPDLKAAIEASLKETEAHRRRENHLPSASVLPTGGVSSQLDVVTVSRTDLQPVEAENVNLFATLVSRLQSAPKGAVLREPQIQELYESITALRPKLARSLGDTINKYESLVETHAKLATVVRLYDRILEARLSTAYNQQPQYSEVPTIYNRQYVPGSSSMAPSTGDSYYTQPPASHLPTQAQNQYGSQQQQSYYIPRHESTMSPYVAIPEHHIQNTADTHRNSILQETQKPKEVSLIDL